MPPDPFDPGAEANFIAAVLEGNQVAKVAFEKRIRCVSGFLRGLNLRRGRPFRDQDLEDINQDIQVIVLRKLPEFRPFAPLEHWIYSICCNEFLNALRRRERHRRRSAETEVDDLPAAPEAMMNPHDDVHRCLERIGGLEAEIIRLKHFDGLTFKEISERTSTPENTVKTRYYRGIARLEAMLGPGSDDE